MKQAGRVRVRLDQPGLYWFGCPISNHAGRGMLGLIIVKGEVPAEAKLDRPKHATAAPLIVKNLVIVGSSGAEYGIRGHLDAFDIETGQRVWRTYTVPKPGEPGGETWGNDSWERGGGSTWITGTYDPDLDLLYWGTGNPGPDFDGSVRPGNNLYTASVIAVDPDDGSIRWHYQWTPHDVWDYDGVNENILFDQNGRRLLAHFDKNGYMFVIDRTNGRFVRAVPFGRVSWGTIDARTGAVTPRVTPTKEGWTSAPARRASKNGRTPRTTAIPVFFTPRWSKSAERSS